MNPLSFGIAAGLLPAALLAQSPAIQRDLVYARPGGIELKLDIAQPSQGEGPFPLVVCVHGGGWQLGNKSGHHATIQTLASQGFVAATVQYRFAPRHPWPAQLEDVKSAVRFLRANAARFKADPSRVAAVGESAGGYLVLMLGLAEASDGFDRGDHLDQSSKVQAVVNYFGPADFTTWRINPLGEPSVEKAYGKGSEQVLADFTGTTNRADPRMSRISTLRYIDPRDPPVLTFQGTLDVLVPAEQARILHRRLKEAGVPESLILLEGQGHGWTGAVKQKTDQQMLAFLEQHLKGKTQALVEPRILKNLTYGHAGGEELKLDLALPAGGNGPHPAVVCIHGGGWQHGSKDQWEYQQLIRALAQRGYAAASVGYRFAPKHRFPAQVEDVKCAVRFLRARAAEWRIDPARIGAVGDSAGGYLALMLGLTGPGDGLEGEGGHAGQSSRVQAVVNYFGGVDMARWRIAPAGELLIQQGFKKNLDGVIADFLGTSDRQAPIMARASHRTYMDAGDAPVLSFHGTLDPLVPVEQAEWLHEDLKKAGIQEELVKFEGALHGWGGRMKEESDRRMFDFLDHHLKRKPVTDSRP